MQRNCGDRESLGNHFWYTDGEKDWTEEAKKAWLEAASPQQQAADLLSLESNRQLVVVPEAVLIAN